MKTTMVVLTNTNDDPYAKKFFEPIGPNGELLLEYTLYDAMESGFERIVVIANEDVKKIIKMPIELRFKGKVEFQWADAKPQSVFSLRKRIPQQYFDDSIYSLWKAKKYLTNPFLVVDARHYHGKRGFDWALHFISTNNDDFGSISLPLGKTLSPYGGVDRAICYLKKSGLELKKIVALEKVRKLNGAIGYANSKNQILSDKIPTTDMYCLNNKFFMAYNGLIKNINKSCKIPSRKIGIPYLINFLVQSKMVRVKVLMVESNWFGTQFKHERILAKHTIEGMIARKRYPQDLGHALSIT